MAEKPYNDTHPKPGREKSLQKEKPLNAQNVGRNESVVSVQWNILNTEKKKQKKNRKKKTSVVNATVDAGSSGAVMPQEAVQARPADIDASTPPSIVLDPLQKYVLEQNYIFLLDKVSYLIN
jgi:hypothetical protein